MQYAMVIDLNRCVGCHACAVACKAEWDVPTDNGRNWVRRLGPARTSYGLSKTYYPGLCNHCDYPPCVDVCPADTVKKTFTCPDTGKTKTMEVAATYKDPFTGVVLIDKDRCLGCGACAEACPYGARYVNPDLGEDGKADKCTFCIERINAGLEPACVQTCLSRARIFGNMNDPDSEVSKYLKNGASRLESNAVKIGPNVYYYGNQRDMQLLKRTCTPREMPEVNLIGKRAVFAKLGKSLTKGAGLAGIVGMACSTLGREDSAEGQEDSMS